ncbi:hypothetical protein IGI37_000720 [Enterococcus sp. AZ194]|uniref:hypothetical protein n=1 Tax=Enterococcus sp. AZ194 TaxID=2774629 RepID=UPI003F2566C5
MSKKFLMAGILAGTLLLGVVVVNAQEVSGLFQSKKNKYEDLLEQTPVFTEAELTDGDATVDELREPYQLTEKELAELSTEELAELVLAYPYLMDIYTFNSLHEGMQAVRARYNGLEELLSRKDSAVVLTKLYQEKTTKLSEKTTEFDFTIEYLEVLLAQEEFQTNRAEISKVVAEASNKKELSDVYVGSMATYGSVLEEQGLVQ